MPRFVQGDADRCRVSLTELFRNPFAREVSTSSTNDDQ